MGQLGISRHRAGFTALELLVVIGVIIVLLGILLPSVRVARTSARNVSCASNMRQIAAALISYAGQNNGSFPTIATRTGLYWFDEHVIGPYLHAPDRVGRPGAIPDGAEKSAGLAGGVFRCPDDLDDSVRSYSMNFYASGAVRSETQKILDGPRSPGKLFKLGAGASDSSKLMLLLESWPELPVNGTKPLVYTAQAVVGFVGKPGERFGGGRGIGWTTPPDGTPDRFETRPSQIAFYRHAKPRPSRIIDPHGEVNFAFCDGHVSLTPQSELVDPTNGKSRFAALWSPTDQEVETK